MCIRDRIANGFDIELRLPDGPTSITGDRDALTNALWNLLDNAVKYSPTHRIVWVDVDHRDQEIEIRVRDHGLGIPASEQRAVFDKFVRGTTAKVEGIAGTGIGLAMVRHIVDAHGGSVTLESAPGAGSTFTVRLPAAEAA